MGCRGCSETENLRRAVRVAEAAADGALGVLADVQNALTERAIDPTPFGQKEQETLSAIAELIKRYVNVSRETEVAHGLGQENESKFGVPNALEQAPRAAADSGKQDSEVHRAGADRLGQRVQPDGPGRVSWRDGLLVHPGPVGARHGRRG